MKPSPWSSFSRTHRFHGCGSGAILQSLLRRVQMHIPASAPRRLRVSLVAPLWPLRGGIAHFATSMARSLVARGHHVHAVTFARQYPDVLFPGKTQLDAGPAPADVPRADALLDTLDPRSWHRAARAIVSDGADVAVLHYWMPFVAPALGSLARALRRRGVRVVVVVHNALPHEAGPVDRPLARYALRGADRWSCSARACAATSSGSAWACP